MKPWMVLALLSALFAALVGVLGKKGLESVDPTLATAIRGLLMAAMLSIAAVMLGKTTGLTSVPRSALGWILLSAACGAASWICYFWALRTGPVGAVAAIDRLSVAFALILAALVLGERLTPMAAAGGSLMVVGAILVVWGRT